MTIDEANAPEPRFRCQGKTPTLRQCWHVATVRVKGKRLCLPCAKKAAK